MKKASPTVSVIIPTYNRCDFLREAIDSVLKQTFADFEVLVVDDGSTDATRDVVMGFGDSRIRYLFQSNSGVASARNWGVASSHAELIAFLDSDDFWLSNKLEVQVKYFEDHPGISVCQTEEIWVRDGVRVNPAEKHRKRSGWVFDDCIPLCIVSPSAVMIRRDAFNALGGFDESLRVCEDYDLWLRTALRYEIHTLPDPLIVKRGGHADQLSRQWGLDIYRIRALRKILGDGLLTEDGRRSVTEDISRRAAIVAEGAMKRGKVEIAEEYRRMV